MPPDGGQPSCQQAAAERHPCATTEATFFTRHGLSGSHLRRRSLFPLGNKQVVLVPPPPHSTLHRPKRQPQLRLRTFIRRDPGLAHLWLGAFLTGAEARCIQNARAGWWKIDLSAAAWTRTHVSFIQGAAAKPPPAAVDISRADECRLLYLVHASNHASPPLSPFRPFGSTAVEDTGLDVRQHMYCPCLHRLGYGGFTWDFEGGQKVKQVGDDDGLEPLLRVKTLQEYSHCLLGGIPVDYDGLDPDEDEETSETATRNMFEWLRGEDGFPVAERAIRQHEWIDNLDWDDDSPIEGDLRSTAGSTLGHGR